MGGKRGRGGEGAREGSPPIHIPGYATATTCVGVVDSSGCAIFVNTPLDLRQ